MKLAGESLIAGRRLAGTGTAFRAVNPATGEVLEPAYASVGPVEVDQAARAAADSFAAYGRCSGAARGAFLATVAAKLDGLVDLLVARATQETALPEARIRSETSRTSNQLRRFALLVEEGSWVDARIDHGDCSRTPVPKPDVRSLLRPTGPVAVFGAANFPLAFSVAGGDTASALAAGCPVIVKAHPSHPGTSELAGTAIVEAVRECGLPDGVFSLLFDHGYEVGRALVAHPLVTAVAFTGSKAGGHALADVARARPEPIPVFAEMSSVNPVFMLPRAVAKRATELAAGLHASVTLGVGQFCTNPGLVVVTRSGHSQHLLELLNSKFSATPPGVMLSSAVASAFANNLSRLAARPGVELVCAPGAGAALLRVGARSFLDDPCQREEVFGPSTLFVECSGPDEMLSVARSLEGQLSASIHGEEPEWADYSELVAVLEAKAGRLVFNGFPTGLEVCDAIVHGGPYPATWDGRTTSVGSRAIGRFARPVCFQDCPQSLLPDELLDSNPLGIRRMVDGQLRHDAD